MTSSDANPIHFWPADEQTFNEKEVCGINPVCWCAPIQIGDNPLLQFIDDGSPEGSPMEFVLQTKNEAGDVVGSVTLTEGSPGGTYSGIPSFPGAGIYSLEVVTAGSSPDEVLLKSDCLNVKAAHPCSNVITFTNASDYADLQYAELGDPTFTIRVPSVFFHEEFEEESEEHELSDNTIMEVSSKIMRKKRFDIDFVPYYFHNKLKLILAHQSISIDGGPWIKLKGDAYEIDKGNKRYPIKKAAVLLTDKNFIKRNLL